MGQKALLILSYSASKNFASSFFESIGIARSYQIYEILINIL